jgi:nucleotidyltransferase substrate binding protein (TIGR01987 family)
MEIRTTPFEQALISLGKAMARSSQEPDDLEVRDACIQRFEYTYELSIKTIKRYIEVEMPIPEKVDQLNYRDLFRVAFEVGLINHVEQWFKFREARNQTSHAYDENKAKAVFQVIPDFIKHAQFLLNQLETRLGKSA